MPSRRMARELALQALFSVEVGHRDAAEVLDEYLSTFSESAHRLFVKELVLGTLEHSSESDRTLSPLLEGWTIERLPTIDRLLLRMGTFELRHRPETPKPVIINEAVELAKRFSTEDSGRFVNGVLSAVSKGNGVA
ncbi:MAG TPA: transcription antitermination factor NusB [Candidatus Baltobacteraceae bacterium]|jgi:N utilization substance protein B|nr:transcription antitermination factor NusB [Candidatus Baltobacteraceae bacterium]